MDFWINQPKEMLVAISSCETILGQNERDIYYIDVEDNVNE